MVTALLIIAAQLQSKQSEPSDMRTSTTKKPKGKAKARTKAAKTKQPKINRRLTFRELQEKGIRESRMTVWRRMQKQQFPQCFADPDSGRVYGWESEIDEHVARLESLPRGPGQRPPSKKEGERSPEAGGAQ